MEEQLAAQLEGILLLGMRHAGRHGHAARLARDIGREVLHFGGLLGVAENAPGRLLAVAALQHLHAVKEARFEIHYPVGILEIARKPCVRAFEHAGAQTQVAGFERRLLRSLRLLPQLLAAELEELDRAAVGDHLLVLLDLLFGVLTSGVLPETRCRQNRDGEDKCVPQATTPSMRLDSPLLSSQLTSILSPLAPPLRRNENTGLRDTAWLVSLSMTVLPFCFTVMFWMKCSGWPLWAVVMGCVISTRTSVYPLASVARIFMGPAISASAASDGHLDLPRGEMVLAARGGDHAH